MHVKAFFEYLMGKQNDYWINIPSGPDPIGSAVRDGVAIEDDMALRALLPHIRPKRGRKRPDVDNGIVSPARRQRTSPPSAHGGFRELQSGGPWQTHPNTQDGLPVDSPNHQHASPWTRDDYLQTPLGQWPQSAVTPNAAGSAWDDAPKPKSAASPSKIKSSSFRRGAKNVSSAWTTATHDPGVRPRGRPPITRTPVEQLCEFSPQNWSAQGDAQSQNPCQMHQQQFPIVGHQAHESRSVDSEASPVMPQHPQMGYNNGKSARPSISIQVPQRAGGSVKLASPAPPQHAEPTRSAVDRHEPPGNSYVAEDDSKHGDGWGRFASEASRPYEERAEQTNGVPVSGLAETHAELSDYYFEKTQDRTNVDILVAYFTRSMTEADWVDSSGQKTESAGLEEASAMVHAMLQSMHKTATSPQAFLINLAALAGSTTLVTTRPKCTRMGEQNGDFTYKCEWNYQFSHVKGGFSFEQLVPASMWKKTQANVDMQPSVSSLNDHGSPAGDSEELFSKEYWQRKYEALTAELANRDRDLANLKDQVMTALGRSFT